MSVKMKNAPLYFTIGQVRYNTISLDAHIAEIRESFRKGGYPDSKQQELSVFNVAGSTAKPDQINIYSFSNMERDCSFTLQKSALTFQSTRYDTFESFIEKFFTGLVLIHKMFAIDLSERVGIRYLNAVMVRDNEKLSQYLIPEVLGLYGKLHGDLIHSFSEFGIKDADYSLVSRVIIRNGQLGLPPDVSLANLQLQPQFIRDVNNHAMIDTDAFYEMREPFNLDNIKNHLNKLHETATDAFQVVITEHARGVWN